MKRDHGELVGYIKHDNYKNHKLVKSNIYFNEIMNAGIKRNMEILGGDVTSNTSLDYIRLGDDNTTPKDKTLTNVKGAIESKLPFGVPSVGSVFPYELNRSVTISSTTITRPVTVYEIGTFFSPHSGGKMFSRVAIPDPGIDFLEDEDDSLTYGLYIT